MLNIQECAIFFASPASEDEARRRFKGAGINVARIRIVDCAKYLGVLVGRGGPAKSWIAPGARLYQRRSD
eukprot:1954391-Pyramimonas_sp.AAC.1